LNQFEYFIQDFIVSNSCFLASWFQSLIRRKKRFEKTLSFQTFPEHKISILDFRGLDEFRNSEVAVNGTVPKWGWKRWTQR